MFSIYELLYKNKKKITAILEKYNVLIEKCLILDSPINYKGDDKIDFNLIVYFNDLLTNTNDSLINIEKNIQNLFVEAKEMKIIKVDTEITLLKRFEQTTQQLLLSEAKPLDSIYATGKKQDELRQLITNIIAKHELSNLLPLLNNISYSKSLDDLQDSAQKDILANLSKTQIPGLMKLGYLYYRYELTYRKSSYRHIYDSLSEDDRRICDSSRLFYPHNVAVFANKMPFIKKIFELNKEFVISSIDSYGDTPLHKAVFTRNCEVASYLLTNGANPAVRNNFGYSVFDLAVLVFKDNLDDNEEYKEFITKLSEHEDAPKDFSSRIGLLKGKDIYTTNEKSLENNGETKKFPFFNN
jgi:hypothetical protein